MEIPGFYYDPEKKKYFKDSLQQQQKRLLALSQKFSIIKLSPQKELFNRELSLLHSKKNIARLFSLTPANQFKIKKINDFFNGDITAFNIDTNGTALLGFSTGLYATVPELQFAQEDNFFTLCTFNSKVTSITTGIYNSTDFKW